MEIDDLTLYWLAGLLEGEGWFGINRSRGVSHPQIAVNMTDEDIIAKVAAIFGVKYHYAYPKRYQENGWRGFFFTRVNGLKAAELMNLIRPLMGQRRQARIDDTVVVYRGRHHALTPDRMEELRQRALNGESPFHLAKEYGISKSLAYYIKDGYTYQQIGISGYSSVVERLPSKQKVASSSLATRSVYKLLITDTPPLQIRNLQIDAKDFHWLAGLLEAEGSFVAPPLLLLTSHVFLFQ